MGGGAVLEQRRGGGAARGVGVERARCRVVRDRQDERVLVQVPHERVEDREAGGDRECLVRRVRHHLVAEVLHLDHVSRRTGRRVEQQPGRVEAVAGIDDRLREVRGERELVEHVRRVEAEDALHLPHRAGADRGVQEELRGEPAAGRVQQRGLQIRLDRHEPRAHQAAERVAHVEDVRVVERGVERRVDRVGMQQADERQQVHVRLPEVVADAEEVVERLEEAEVHAQEARIRVVGEAVRRRRAAEAVVGVLRARRAGAAVPVAVTVLGGVDADRREALGGVELTEDDDEVALSAEPVLLDHDRPPGGRGRAARDDDRERDLRRVDDDRGAAAVARETLVVRLARTGRGAGGKRRWNGKVGEGAVAVRVVRLEARASVEAGRDGGDLRRRRRPEEVRHAHRAFEDEAGLAREVCGRHGKAGQHRGLDRQEVRRRRLGREDRHARDVARRHAVSAERRDHRIEDRVGVGVGARAVAHREPVGRRLDRLPAARHAAADDAGVAGLRRERLAGQR